MSSSGPVSDQPIPQQRRSKMATSNEASSSTPTRPTLSSSRGSPYLPTSRETLLLAIFPALLLFGTIFSTLSPQTRAAAAAATTAGSASATSHYPQSPEFAPSYFARKSNVLNVLFVKRGWFWITVTFFAFVATHPYFTAVQKAPSKTLFGRRASAAIRWSLVTGWWILVTQWFFGPALIDRSFRLTGGGCEALQALADEIEAEAVQQGRAGSTSAQFLNAASSSSACKNAGGTWSGGHDISGHVFLLTLGTTFLAQEIGWVLWRKVAASTATGARAVDSRAIVMGDGAVKSAEVEAGLGGSVLESPAVLSSVLVTRFASVVVGLSMWMLLMTAIYFHTWPEKLTGLIVALTGYYGVYVVPRFVPALRHVVGLPGL
ncbi:inositol phospholipid synthesis protein scs3p [Ophiostoma piceae UAMH 11346]|uniref:Acyl-coenzyme A diphosphatase SCS3 n=1 Tax=Ophiostoma piceae (strain UAMH 11346) TaxID=1262450 RepID=S3CVS7_OPHP1|nr:inositol phospholipid synthesis protein scs3p [Ophiostoma piceae UAMH 11346]